MICSFRHKGLKRLFERGDAKGVRQDHVTRLRLILSRLNRAQHPADMDLPGYRLHPLKGGLKGFYAVDVSGNWRVIFRMDGGDAFDVDYDDYH